MLDWNHAHASAPTLYFWPPDDRFGSPVAALDQRLGSCRSDQGKGRVLIEPGDEIDGFQRGDYGDTILQCVDRAICALVQPASRYVAVHRDEKACAKCPGPGEIRDMAAVQDIEYAVGENERPRE